MKSEVTIVTACDRNYLWGAFLLAASVARNIPNVPLNVVQTGFTEEDKEHFQQLPMVNVHTLSNDDPRNVTNRKSEALFTAADSEYIAWMDSDCMIVGNVESMLIPENGEFQIRLRDVEENSQIWCNHYQAGETRQGVPKAVLAQWREDVGGLDTPTHNTACVANVFVLHRRHLDFIHQLKTQIAKVIAPVNTGLVDRRSRPYFMIDESVLSSLIAFSDIAPPVSPFLLNRDPNAHVAHFALSPKPWVRWRKLYWPYHEAVMDLIDWLQANGYTVPEIPWSLRRSSTMAAKQIANAESIYAGARTMAGDFRRRLDRRRS